MKTLLIFASIFASLMLATPVFADIEEEMIETEAAIADSEASIEEAAILEKQLIIEERQARAEAAKARQHLRDANRKKVKADKEIAINEKKIEKAKAEIAKAKKQISDSQRAQEKMRKKVGATYDKLKANEKTRDQFRSELKDEKRKLGRLTDRQKKAHKQAVAAANESNKAKKEMRHIRIKIRRAMANRRKSRSAGKIMIAKYRKSLNKALKELAELEVMIEADAAYDKKLARVSKGKLPKGFRSVSGLNLPRNKKVIVSRCRLREFPNGKSKVIGSYTRGKKIRARYHNAKWFTLVYGGEKVFIGKGCLG